MIEGTVIAAGEVWQLSDSVTILRKLFKLAKDVTLIGKV